MSKHIDLVNGPVLSSLTRLALPIMATSLIQMAYNLTDMLWIGRLGQRCGWLPSAQPGCICGSPTAWAALAQNGRPGVHRARARSGQAEGSRLLRLGSPVDDSLRWAFSMGCAAFCSLIR